MVEKEVLIPDESKTNFTAPSASHSRPGLKKTLIYRSESTYSIYTTSLLGNILPSSEWQCASILPPPASIFCYRRDRLGMLVFYTQNDKKE